MKKRNSHRNEFQAGYWTGEVTFQKNTGQIRWENEYKTLDCGIKNQPLSLCSFIVMFDSYASCQVIVPSQDRHQQYAPAQLFFGIGSRFFNKACTLSDRITFMESVLNVPDLVILYLPLNNFSLSSFFISYKKVSLIIINTL